jgi:LPXTG-site transpeptidase (sortase) family protein
VDGVTDGGLNVNREAYNQFRRNDSQMPNNYYTVEITGDELTYIRSYLANPNNNYYSFFIKNCGTGAVDLWNEALIDRPELQVKGNYTGFGVDPESLYIELGLMNLNQDLDGEGGSNFYPRLTDGYDYCPVPPEPEPRPEPLPVGPDGTQYSRLCMDCQLPATGFSSVHAAPLSVQPKDLNYRPMPMRIQIPTLELDMELVDVPLEDKTWRVEWLGESAGLLSGSSLPGEGLSIIAAHNTLNSTAYGPFALLSTMEVNDSIFVNGEDNKLTIFRVYANELLDANGMEELLSIAEKTENTLVLVTCENESIDGGYLNRRVIFAKPVGSL